MTQTFEIYGLYDPETDELRYVGKARCHKDRFARHLSESRTCNRPVNRWIAGLVSSGKLPHAKVLEIAVGDAWKEAEIRLIAQYRQTCDLLNIAEGGDRPHQTKEQRSNAAKAANKAMANRSEAWKKLVLAKQGMARLATEYKKRGDTEAYEEIRAKMREYAARRPDLFGGWANA